MIRPNRQPFQQGDEAAVMCAGTSRALASLPLSVGQSSCLSALRSLDYPLTAASCAHAALHAHLC